MSKSELMEHGDEEEEDNMKVDSNGDEKSEELCHAVASTWYCSYAFKV